MNNSYNTVIDLIGALLVGAVFLAERRQQRYGDPLGAHLLRSLLLCCALVLLSDIPGLLLDGATFPAARALLWLFDTVYWVLQIIFCWLWLLFTCYRVNGDAARVKRFAPLFAVPMAAELLLIAVNLFTGWIFTLDSANVYTHGSYHMLNLLPYILYLAGSLGVTVCGCLRTCSAEQRRSRFLPAVCMFLPVCGLYVELFVYEVALVWPMTALSMLTVYLNSQQQAFADERLAAARLEAELYEKKLSAAKLESELTESRVAIMLSQIQPHFLYNSLNTVDALCDVDTKAAQSAIRSFARYLRGNLDAISRKTPVPFRDELSHLREYLTLETFRFDNIQVEYDLEVLDFMLPALSLQPIVENAVKYGVLEREHGGTITISTRDKRDHVQLTVQDDGVGFDQTRAPDGKRTHIGISNVRSRLESMCGGTLTLESAPGVGTIVTFIIPWGGERP